MVVKVKVRKKEIKERDPIDNCSSCSKNVNGEMTQI